MRDRFCALLSDTAAAPVSRPASAPLTLHLVLTGHGTSGIVITTAIAPHSNKIIFPCHADARYPIRLPYFGKMRAAYNPHNRAGKH